MNITVFGASGGIGSHVVALAARRGHSVRAVYRATPPVPPPGRADILIAPDILDLAFTTEATGGADVVVSAACPTSPPATTRAPP